MIIRGVKKLGITLFNNIANNWQYVFELVCTNGMPMFALDYPINHVLWVVQLYNKQHGIFSILDMNR